MEIENHSKEYKRLISRITDAYTKGRQQAVIAVNTHLVEAYWSIGQYIVEFEQKGKAKAEYGKNLLENLSKDLSLLHGKGFSNSNLKRMRQFYLTYPIRAELPHQLRWTHWVELLKIDNSLERSFYLQQTILENWSTTQLIRQKSLLYFCVWPLQKTRKEFYNSQKRGKLLKNPSILFENPMCWSFYKFPNPII